MKKQISCIITGLLIVSLIGMTLKAADTKGAASSQSIAKPKLVLECVVISILAGTVLYAVYRCAKAAGLTSPPQPPSNTNTNSVNGNFVIKPHDLTPPGTGSTNDSGTNTYSSNLVPGSSIVYFNNALATNNDANMEVIQDISTNGWTDWQGNPYTWFLVTQTDPTGQHIQTNTNLSTSTWTDANYTMSVWLSSTISPDSGMSHFTNMVAILYDGNGIPLITNWSSIKPNTPVNIGIPATEAQMYFRGVTP